jgi:enolase-phosphatase E1
MKPRAIVTDVEGTTSSIAFVHQVLFPYSLARIGGYVAAHPREVAVILDDVREEAGDADLGTDDCVALLRQWHEADLKIGPLKRLQGLIWAEGYAAGDFKGHVFPDAVAGLERWRGWRIALYVFSSGSIDAQKLLFRHTAYGDLTPLFSGHFDTAIGSKLDPSSYRVISNQLGLTPQEILFLSDVEAELSAALEAGFEVTLLARDGVPPLTAFPVARTFATILPSRDT